MQKRQKPGRARSTISNSALEMTLARDVFYKHFKRDFEGFVLTQSERRLKALHRAAKPVLHSNRSGDYLFATFEALESDDFPKWE